MLDVHRIAAIRPRWCGPALHEVAPLGVQVRAHGEEVPAAVTPTGSGFVAELVSPLRGVAPGQAAVLYDGTRVVGSGTIARGAA
jgi:tRNA-specific 2-thiouridylase